MTYADKLRDPRWQKRRLVVLERDQWKCQLCSDEKDTLNVHHLQYHGEPWDTPDEQLITYCEHCHFLVSNADAKVLRISKSHIHNKPNCRYFIGLYCSEKYGYYIGISEFDGFAKNYKWVDVIPAFQFNTILDFINIAKSGVERLIWPDTEQ